MNIDYLPTLNNMNSIVWPEKKHLTWFVASQAKSQAVVWKFFEVNFNLRYRELFEYIQSYMRERKW